MKPYISINIQTTGLVEQDWTSPEVICLAMVIDDFKTPVNELNYLYLIIAPDDNQPISYSSDYVKEAHSELDRKINAFRKKGKSIIEVPEKETGLTMTYCRKSLASKVIYDFILNSYKEHGQLQIAGKNPEMFDLYTLFMNKLFNRRLKIDGKDVIFHRGIDVGSMYYHPPFNQVPSLGDILKFIDPEHEPSYDKRYNSLFSAFEVIKVIRHKHL